MSQKKDFENSSLINFFLWFLGIFAIWILTYILQKTNSSNQSSLLLMLTPVILGITYENLKLGSNWKFVLLKIFVSIILSLVVFHHDKTNLNFVFEDRINFWAYFFIAIFVIISTIFHKDKTIPKLTEGITLLHSIAFIYWVIELDVKNLTTYLILVFLVISLSIITFIHSLSYIELTKKYRLFLSLWSSIIMVVFSINTIIRVIKLESYKNLEVLNILQNTFYYFILGISLVYIFKNASILYAYIPSNNNNYKTDLKKINAKHIKRFSNIQVEIKDSIFAIVTTSITFCINYIFKLIPSNILIWIVFITFPIILNFLKTKTNL